MVENSSLAAQVHKVGNEHKVRVFHMAHKTATLRDAALATTQGKRVLEGRNVSLFANISYHHYDATPVDTEQAVAEFD